MVNCVKRLQPLETTLAGAGGPRRPCTHVHVWPSCQRIGTATQQSPLVTRGVLSVWPAVIAVRSWLLLSYSLPTLT